MKTNSECNFSPEKSIDNLGAAILLTSTTCTMYAILKDIKSTTPKIETEICSFILITY